MLPRYLGEEVAWHVVHFIEPRTTWFIVTEVANETVLWQKEHSISPVGICSAGRPTVFLAGSPLWQERQDLGVPLKIEFMWQLAHVWHLPVER